MYNTNTKIDMISMQHIVIIFRMDSFISFLKVIKENDAQRNS